MYSPEVQSRLATIRAKASDGSATVEDYREAIKLIREGRVSALNAQKAKSSAGSGRKTKAPVNTDALFDELGKI